MVEKERRKRKRIMRKRRRRRAIIRASFTVSLLILALFFALYHIFDKPVITLKGDKTITVEVLSDYKDQGAVAKVHKKDLTEQLTTSGEVDTSTLGSYEIEYTLAYKKKNYTVKREVQVIDDIAPEIELQGNSKLTLYSGSSYNEAGVKATDNYDGDISSKVVTTGEVDDKTPGTYEITYSVEDSSGNKASATREVKVMEPPSDNSSIVYLTFDDGPSTEVTPRVLDILKANNVKATFFIIDYSDENEALIKRIYNEGHTIGIHGYSHKYEKIYASEEAFMNNIYKLREKVKNSTGYEPNVIRFPGGSSNTISKNYCSGIMTKLSKRVIDEGFQYFDWNVDSGDADDTTVAKDKIVANFKRGLYKGHGNVVLMHDCAPKTTTADALQEIINYGKSNGFEFLPITDRTVPVHHGVNN